MKVKILRITGCSDSLMWYSKNIGNIAVYLGDDMDARGPIYWSRDNGGYKNIVFQRDAELIEVDSDVVDSENN